MTQIKKTYLSFLSNGKTNKTKQNQQKTPNIK